ncbi:MAG: PAS domain-containing sensor histidine kinase [Oceanicaulis sp.]
MRALAAAPGAVKRVSMFGVAFFAAAGGAVALALMAVGGEGTFGPGGAVFAAALAFVAVVTLGLGVLVGIKATQNLRARKLGEPVPRLQLRFMTLFAVAAVVPALLMAGFQALVLGRGIEFWFGQHVNSVVEQSADLAREWPQVAMRSAQIQLNGLSRDLSFPDALRGMRDNRILYRRYLVEQARLRGFPALYIVNDQAAVLARAEPAADAPAYVAPSQSMFDIANEGDIGTSDPQVRENGPDYVRMLVRLPNTENLYLYTLWYVDFSLLSAQEEMTNSFREAEAREAQMRGGFFLVYALASALIFVGAVWLALSSARRVVDPVSRLVSAAERVRRGDLDARVDVARDDDEIAALGRAFNRMTRQLSSQRGELIAASEESERRRAFIEAVLTGVSAGVIGLEPSGRIMLVNRSAAQLLGCEPEDLVGEPLETAAPVFETVVQDVLRRPEEIAERQIDVAAEDGAVVHLNVRAGHDEEGGLVITFDDVTRLVAAQRNAAWRDVARRIAHEIKNPLTPIQLSAERLRRRYRDQVEEAGLETFDKCVDTIVRQVSDIGRMVDEFSAFARMPAPKMERVDLNEIAGGAVFAQRVASPAIKLPFAMPEAPVTVECDSRLASQALANILKNAAESVSARMEQDGAKTQGSISVRVYRDNGFGVIEARDDGLGWPTADKARLTEPYMTTREKGTGLGLAIVRRVMEDHGGRLELDDPPEGQTGAVVRLAFPLLEPDPGALEAPARAEA